MVLIGSVNGWRPERANRTWKHKAIHAIESDKGLEGHRTKKSEGLVAPCDNDRKQIEGGELKSVWLAQHRVYSKFDLYQGRIPRYIRERSPTNHTPTRLDLPHDIPANHSMPREIKRVAEDDVAAMSTRPKTTANTNHGNDSREAKTVNVPTNVPVIPRVTSVSSADIRIPLELWREVIREAGAIQDEFECPPFHSEATRVSPSWLGLARWYKAFQTRLSLALVSRTWYFIALEYLYSFLLFREVSSIMPTVTRLSDTNLTRWVQRVTLLSLTTPQELRPLLELLPTLRYLQCSPDQLKEPLIFDLSSLCRHLTSLSNIFVDTKIAQILSELPNLQHLECRVRLSGKTDRPIIWPRLHTLWITLEWIGPEAHLPLMPNLRALRIGHCMWSHDMWNLLEAHIPTIHTFASNDDRPIDRRIDQPNVPLSAPHLREVIIRDSGPNLVHLSSYISLASVEIIHLPLERQVQRTIVQKTQIEEKRCILDEISKSLQIIRDLSRKPRLHTVRTDLTSNVLTVAGSQIRKSLETWLEELEARNIRVFTRVYETISDNGREVPLAGVFNAPPGFAFWPAYPDDY